jgi:flagellin
MTINNSSYININNLNQASSTALEKISSGLAINKAADDASGLAIADKLGVQKSSLVQSVENANSGIAMSNIAQSSISEQKKHIGKYQNRNLESYERHYKSRGQGSYSRTD